MDKSGTAKKRVQVEIYGDKYVVKGDADDKHILQIADYVDIKMNMIAQRSPHLSAKQVAVLAALNIADELYRLQDDYDKMLQILEEVKEG
ncbi:MAG: cell division protein ZapA [Clostridia bacterium]|nr:cell division protein ZapA [Clostridia bacterium]